MKENFKIKNETNPKFKITTINMKWSRKHFSKAKNLLDHFKQLQLMYLEDILYTIYRLKTS
jgi:hypothetical protein